MAGASGQQNVLGWIKPDDGVRVNGRFLDYECFRFDEWLALNGCEGIGVRVETSVADTYHIEQDLLNTGAVERLLPPARRLEESGCEALCWACTSGSFIGGLDWARAQAGALAEATGLPTTSTSLAIISAIKQLDAGGVDILSPYPEPVTGALQTFLGEAGIKTGNVMSLDCPTGSDSHRLSLHQEVARFAERFPRSPHLLLIPDTAVNTLGLVSTFEADLNRPVITANQATLWWGVQLLGGPSRIVNMGTLFDGPTAATGRESLPR